MALSEFMSEIVNEFTFIFHSYYNWAVAAPVVLSMSAFQKNLPKVFFFFGGGGSKQDHS